MSTKAMPAGSSRREFLRLAAMETDDCVIWPYAKGSQRGYGQTYLDGLKKYTHREALLLRVEQPADKPFALHGPCNQPACMNYRHLRWGTARENTEDQRRDGTSLRGERNPQAKLSVDQVRSIRAEFAAGASQRRLAVTYGVGVMTINRAIRRESWVAA